MADIYYAKSKLSNGKHPTVTEHIDKVAYYAALYGRALDMEAEASIAGQFHDFGKYSDAFAKVLTGERVHIDHAFCGATLLYNTQRIKEKYLHIIEAINGHHDGLVEIAQLENYMRTNFLEDAALTTPCGKESALMGRNAYQEAFTQFKKEHPDYTLPKIKPFDEESNVDNMLHSRMLLSCLVDADYSVSAADEDEEYFQKTESFSLDAEKWLQKLYGERDTIRQRSTADSDLNRIRDEVFEKCGNAGEYCPEGLFTLTAPTGTGKTLALLHFALRHCIATLKKRIIFVLPYLTLAEQNTRVYEAIVPDILEDHSQCEYTDETREMAERWSHPFIITTSVKFFESLFAKKPTDCRILHNVANSVVVFDEAQSLPNDVTDATIQAVNELCRRYHTTMVFSTATQPDFAARPNATWTPHEILPEHPKMYEALRRTEVIWRHREETELNNIAEEMAKETSVCTIVNLRRHARELFIALRDICCGDPDSIFYLTTDLCPAHRIAVVDAIKARLYAGKPCRLVATQCIEAGVDLDFQVMYRALAPLEAIIQAAGRCNRNGSATLGKVIVFKPKDEKTIYPERWYGNAAEIVGQQNTHKTIDIHDPKQIKQYYETLFQNAKDKLELRNALKNRDYDEVQRRYRLIDTRGVQVIVPYNDMCDIFDSIRNEVLERGITKKLMKDAAPITVTSYLPAEELCMLAEPIRYRLKGKIGKENSCFCILRPQYAKLYTDDMGLQVPENGLCVDLSEL